MKAHGGARPLFVDARCLQDELYRFRGIGFHTAGLLRTRPAADWRAIAMLDPALPPLPPEHASLFDDTTYSWNPPIPAGGAVFLSASPMTHDPLPTLRFAAHPRLVRAAVVYDFIPLDRAGYFPSLSSRMEYIARLARLREFDLYLPISQGTSQRLLDLLPVAERPRAVTGAAVRESLYEAAARLPRNDGPRELYVFTLGGGDRRKNTEVVVRAVRRLREAGLSIGLKIVGHYGEDYRRDLHDLAGAAAPDYVEFLSDISDEALAALYRGAAVSVAPSFIEGFSLPVVEAAVCGVPTLASDCDAHRELISHPEALFAPDDDGALSTRIGRAVAYPELREQLLASQAGLAEEFRERVVGRRCWDAIGAEAAHRGRAFSVSRNAKPRIAFLSPFPPQPSGVSRFTELTLQAGSKLFSADLYTDASRPLVGDGIWFRDGGRLHEAVLRRANYDAVVGVLGNSHFHSTTIDLIERFGGPCILHDSRLTQIRYDRLGHDGFTRFAEQLLARSVSYAEVVDWIHDREPPTLFLEPVLRRASPLIVHTRAFQDLLKRQYGVEAEVATFPPNHLFGDEELSEENRRAARSRLGIPDDVFAVVSLGHVAPPKGTACMMAAIDLLRKWGIPAHLYLAGGTGNDLRAGQVAEMIGVSAHVRLHEGFLPEEMYRDYAVAADAAVQLRTYGFGQPSAGLTDCVSAAVPTVATESLAAACEAPEFVLTVPDRFSPLHVAQKLAELYTGGRTDRTELLDQRAEFLRTHSFEHYAIRLMESLGYA